MTKATPGGDAVGEELTASEAWQQAVDGFEKLSGLLDLYVDATAGKVMLALPAPAADGVVGSYLYVEGLTSGLGSNPIGLDRGQLGEARVIDVVRRGRKVLFEQPNLGFRALTDNAAEALATRRAFATSVLWAADAELIAPDGRALVDLTSFLLTDAHGVARTLADTGQGEYQLDLERSVVDATACLAFPDNLEFEALLTWQGTATGEHVARTVPTADVVTLTQHHSLVRLPDDGYQPRRFDPRMGSFAISFRDYAAPLDTPIEMQWIVRHRLERTDPSAASSPAKEPIVYYVDLGTPEPIRSALIEGAGWWREAFAIAGFDDAFRVELLPAGAHPLDVRYNVIQWVHRSTRGWSYGGGVVDPRTGEMIKGHVILGSLRIRQDILLLEGLTTAAGTGSGRADDPIEVALARIRQLAAHEVGHTLGFNHNFAASTYGRASVMDYPAPWVRVGEGGAIDLSQAYAVGSGVWDDHSTNYAYREFPPGTDEERALKSIVADGLERGYLFLSDEDTRPPGAAHPRAGLWDNGDDSLAALAEVLAVRRIALKSFGEHNLAAGRPLALLEEVLAPLYFHHRYQLAVTAKLIGGVDYRYKLAGDSQPLPKAVSSERQRAALALMLQAMSPETLALPANVLRVMHPRAVGTHPNRELFRGRSDPLFDPVAAAAVAADLAIAAVLEPARLNRVADAENSPGALTVGEILAGIVETTFAPSGEQLASVASGVQEVAVARLAALAADERAAVTVRAAAEVALGTLPAGASGSVAEYLRRSAARWLERTVAATIAPHSAPEPPPGDPIGGGLAQLMSLETPMAHCSWTSNGGL